MVGRAGNPVYAPSCSNLLDSIFGRANYTASVGRQIIFGVGVPVAAVIYRTTIPALIGISLIASTFVAFLQGLGCHYGS